MGEKDISEWNLEDYPDVFADILNVLLFQGQSVVAEEELAETGVKSQFKADDSRLHEQERDIAKYWMKDGKVRAMIGIENQTAYDADMPLRIDSYDGASHKSQVLHRRCVTDKERYPVFTLVLYFGRNHWGKIRSLHERMTIPKELYPYLYDKKIQIFEMSHLTEEQLESFQSDFGVIAEYFVRSRESVKYKPKRRKIRHVDACLKMLAVFTQDASFLEEAPELIARQKKGEEITMCEVLDYHRNQGIIAGKELGHREGIREGLVQGIREGIDVLNRLNQLLLQDNRMQDLVKATQDDDYQKALLNEYGLQ